MRQKMRAGEIALCIGLRQARTADIAMMAAACGFDAVYVDMEHSPITFDSASTICAGAMAAGIDALIRTPGHNAHDVGRSLDGGASGVILPHVGTAEQAQAIADAARFPPVGHRSVMGACPSLLYRSLPLAQTNERLNEETLIVAMLETPEGIANADAIAAVDGIDVLLIGSNDLCTELGIPGQLRHPKLREAYESAAQACRAHNKILGVGGVRGDAELTSTLIELGARFLIVGSDVGYFMAAARKDVEQLRALRTAKS